SKEIIPKLDELEDKSNKLLDKTANNSGTVADRIGGNLNEQLKLIHVDSYNEFLTQFENNCNKLETWKSDIENCLDTLNGEKDKILDVVKTAIAIKDRPQDTKNNLDKINIETGINKLDNNLSDLKELGRMDNVYKLPDFKLNPEPNEIEENQFKKCFYDKYFDQITEEIEKDLNTPDPKKDDAQLNSVKNDAIDLADVIVNQEEAQSSKELNKDELPSEHGPISSEKALEEIALLLEKSALNYIVSEEFISNPFLEPHQGLDSIDEKEKSFFDYEVEKIKKLFELIKDILKNGIELLVESLYMNEYIVSSFKCASVQNNVIKNDIGWNRPLDSTFFDKGEVEYILFGKAKEATNINLSKTSIFAIRLAFNLLHVYTDPVKLSQTLSWATAIAGWTIFGVPVVQNLLLILWAAAESYVDMSILFKGEHVSMIKTSSSWYVSLENLKGEALKDIKNFAQNQVEKLIDNIENAVKETLDGIIDAKIDKLFEPFEKGLEKTTGSAANSIENIGNDFTQNIIKNMKFDNAEIFASTLETALKNGIESIKNKVENLGRNALADFKDKFKQEIKDAIFGSYLFDGLVEEIKEVGNSLIDKGFNAVSEQIDNALGSPGNSSSNNIAGRFIMMDYEDYLRLMLFTVTKNNKSLRTADLIQTNMTAFKGENVYISDYCTYIFVRAEVDFNPWFIPEYFFKSKNNLGMISVEWSQGY
ncbi:MAG: hypothetical protein GX957_12580, partial [Clostridiaceae bacterium]|nr:hypothetical protein [Clostridiaceae bacterium]